MSVIVALKHESFIYVACSSQSTSNGACYGIHPIWIKYNNVILATSGSVKIRNIIRRSIPFQSITPTIDDVNIYSIDNLYPILKDIKEKWDILICGNSSIFRIDNNFCVIEVEKYDAIGIGATASLGYLYGTEKMTAPLRVEGAIRAAIKYSFVKGLIFTDRI